jgi:hypothetical protein
MSRSEHCVTLFHPAAFPNNSVYGYVPFVLPGFGSALYHVFVRCLNTECLVDICANIWVESADELFYVHWHFVRVVQIYSVAVWMAVLLQIVGWLWMKLYREGHPECFMAWMSVLQNCVYLFGFSLSGYLMLLL